MATSYRLIEISFGGKFSVSLPKKAYDKITLPSKAAFGIFPAILQRDTAIFACMAENIFKARAIQTGLSIPAINKVSAQFSVDLTKIFYHSAPLNNQCFL